MARTLRRSALTLTVLSALASAIPAGATAPSRIIDQVEEDCEELVPASYGISGVTDEGQTVSLDVRVVLDVAEGLQIERLRAQAAEETDPDRAAQLEAQAEALHEEQVGRATDLIDASIGSYAPLDVTFNMIGFDYLAMLDEDGTARSRTDHAQDIIDLAKEQYGGSRPEGSDVVYVLTDQDIQLPDLGYIVAGLADCIGGVRYPGRAFAVGEIAASIPIGPVTFYYEATAKIAAHEIGHLMGAHHHYQNCVEGIPTELVEACEPSPCTLMTNAVDFQSLNFGQIEAAVVRGHAVDFADEAPPA